MPDFLKHHGSMATASFQASPIRDYDEGFYFPSAKLFKSIVHPQAMEKAISKQLEAVVSAATDKTISGQDFFEVVNGLVDLARIYRNIEAAEADNAKN